VEVSGVNSLKINGNVGKDPVSRVTKSGKEMASFSLAHSTGKDDQKTTIWFDVLAFDELAAQVVEGVRKGSRVLVEGRFSIETYEKRDGTPGTAYKILANSVVLEAKREPAEPSAEEWGGF
jgi:single-strand DNA-binding protein